MKKTCPQRESNPVPSAYEADRLPTAPWDLIYIDWDEHTNITDIEHLKIDRVLPECAIYLNYVEDEAKCFMCIKFLANV